MLSGRTCQRMTALKTAITAQTSHIPSYREYWIRRGKMQYATPLGSSGQSHKGTRVGSSINFNQICFDPNTSSGVIDTAHCWSKLEATGTLSCFWFGFLFLGGIYHTLVVHLQQYFKSWHNSQWPTITVNIKLELPFIMFSYLMLCCQIHNILKDYQAHWQFSSDCTFIFIPC